VRELQQVRWQFSDFLIGFDFLVDFLNFTIWLIRRAGKRCLNLR
jgi:hypothetical protein